MLIFTTLYVLIIGFLFYNNYYIAGSIFILVGLFFIMLYPVYIKICKQSTAEKIKLNCKKPFINVNKAPWYILEELPSIDAIVAKKIVFIRKQYGLYKSLDDFFTKNQIAENFKKALSRYIHI